MKQNTKGNRELYFGFNIQVFYKNKTDIGNDSEELGTKMLGARNFEKREQLA